MTKRNTIIVVFRVVAIFILFSIVAQIPRIILEWNQVGSLEDLTTRGTAFSTMLIRSVAVIAIPLLVIFLLWNRSSWIADRILAPFGMDELWDDDSPKSEDEVSDGEGSFQESTLTHLTFEEIESLAFVIVGVWAIVASLPDLIMDIVRLLTARYGEYFSYLVSPLCKSLIGFFLVTRSYYLVEWVAKIRKSRMQE